MSDLSRVEDILDATINSEPYDEPPQSRIEEKLIELKEVIEEGGGGGGSVVTITPTLESGTKIADYSINGSEGELYAPTPSAGSTTLAGLTDVDLSSPTDGQGLVYDEETGKWVNADGSSGSSSLSGLTDVDLSSPTDGQGLVYDAENEKWVNADISGGTVVKENMFGYIDTTAISARYATGSISGGNFNFSMQEDASDWSTSATAYNNTAIDLSDIDTLKIDVTISEQSGYGAFWVTLSTTKYTWDGNSWPSIYANVDSAIKITESGSYEIDTSSLTGNYYIYIGGTTGKDTVTHGDCNNGYDGKIIGSVTSFVGESKMPSNLDQCTLPEYNELTQQQKMDGTARFIPASNVGTISEIDCTDITGYYENHSVMDVSASSDSEIDITYSGGVQIGCNFRFNDPIDVTDWDKIVFKVLTGSCYGGGSTAQQTRWDLQVGLLDFAITQAMDIPPSDSRWKAVVDMPKANNDYGEVELDVSDLTGELYLTSVCHGWNAVLEDFTLATFGGYSSRIMYMGNTYGMNNGVRYIEEDDYEDLPQVTKLNGTAFFVKGGESEYTVERYEYLDGGVILVEHNQDLSYNKWYFYDVTVPQAKMDVPNDLLAYVPNFSNNQGCYNVNWITDTQSENLVGVAKPNGYNSPIIGMITVGWSSWVGGVANAVIDMNGPQYSSYQNNPMSSPGNPNRIMCMGHCFGKYDEY